MTYCRSVFYIQSMGQYSLLRAFSNFRNIRPLLILKNQCNTFWNKSIVLTSIDSKMYKLKSSLTFRIKMAPFKFLFWLNSTIFVSGQALFSYLKYHYFIPIHCILYTIHIKLNSAIYSIHTKHGLYINAARYIVSTWYIVEQRYAEEVCSSIKCKY